MSRFDDLSDYDFELLVADLLGHEYSRSFETFPRGRDGGIDLRAQLGNGLRIGQCKHYPHSSFSRLERAAKREREVLTEMRPRPRRYTFVTSRSLTALNKDRLVAALEPYVRAPSDILGYDDLLRLLRRHPSVERAHVKLWLTSSAVLDRIVHADVYARSEALIEDIRAALPRYVQTRSFGEAYSLLSDHNVVIIAGPPGVGKTTLARLLVLDAVHRGFTPYAVQADPAEAWRVFKTDQPQVFFFDDFLGRTSLFDVVSEDPRDLATLIRHARRVESTRLILATREYVLQQAKRAVEEFQWQALDTDKYSLTLDQYSRLERARILYNHLYFSPEVDNNALRSLRQNRAYLNVVDHRGYSPRLIEWMTGLGGHRLSGEEKADYADYCVSVLDHPEELWRFAFEEGLDAPAQLLLIVLASLPAVVELNDLEAAFNASAHAQALKTGRREFDAALKVLQDSFVSFSGRGGRTESVSAINPSLVDFLERRLAGRLDSLQQAVTGALFFEQVEWYQGVASRAGLDSGKSWRVTLAEALTRTVERRSAKSLPYGWYVRQNPAERVQTLAGWCRAQPGLTPYVVPAFRALAARLMRDIPQQHGAELMEHAGAIAALREFEVSWESLAQALKERLLDLEDDVDAYSVLARLRQKVGSISRDEWSDIQDRFANWALDETADWEDSTDLEELDRIEEVASELGVTLNEFD